MPWDVARVQRAWTQNPGLPDYITKYFAAFAAVANAFEVAGATVDDACVSMALYSAGSNSRSDDPTRIRHVFIGDMECNTDMDPAPPAALAVLFQAGEVIPDVPQAPRPPSHINLPLPMPDELKPHRLRLQQMRSIERARRGRLLAAKAKDKLGQWRWVPRGDSAILPVLPTDLQRTEGAKGINTFSLWLQNVRMKFKEATALNCREAVLVIAWQAGLLTHGQVRAAYSDAETKAKGILGSTLLEFQRGPYFPSAIGSAALIAYLECLDRRLTSYQSAVPVSLDHGLIPRAGDLVFGPHDGAPSVYGHVGISLGRDHDTRLDRVASIGHAGGDVFESVELLEMGINKNELRFLPCPF